MSQNRPSFRQVPEPLDEVPDEELAKFSQGRGVPSLVTPASKTLPAAPQIDEDAAKSEPRIPPTAETPAAKKTVPASRRAPPSTRLAVMLPVYLSDAINVRAAQERSTARHLVMQGLQAIGFHIEENDLTPDRRRFATKRRRR